MKSLSALSLALILAATALLILPTNNHPPFRPLAIYKSDMLSNLNQVTGDPVLVGAADIADCSTSGSQATALLLDHIPGTVFAAGDTVYPDGSLADYQRCFEPTWGRHRQRIYPATGNHEYRTAQAGDYFTYFGDRAGPRGLGYYSYALGAWHIVVLNSNCDQINCRTGGAQDNWLAADLKSHPNQCTLAYFHHPRFSSGLHGSQSALGDIWQRLYTSGVDVVVNGHDHDYERFAPQNPAGQVDPQGIQEFVVGTGGAQLHTILRPIKNSLVHATNTYGVIKFTLHPTSYDWQFLPVPGQTFTDSGQGTCH